jgi:hypothetical protein
LLLQVARLAQLVELQTQLLAIMVLQVQQIAARRYWARQRQHNFSKAALGQNGAYIVAGGAVTPAASITITVGAGGTAGTNGAAGGSGYVWIEYQV